MIWKISVGLIIAYIIVSITQFSASFAGLVHFFHLNWFFAFFAGLILTFIPAIGPLAGVYGAVVVWQWPLFFAILLFFWPYALYGLLSVFGVTNYFLFFKKFLHPFANTKNETQDFEPEYTVKETKNAEPKDSAISVTYIEKK